jgi:uncharacterized phage-associated protein
MASANDVAAYLLARAGGALEQMKLQKLLYYCQVWHQANYRRPLFPDRIEAWANGPVLPEFWEQHRNEFIVRKVASSVALTAFDQALVDAVLMRYDQYTGVQLSQLTHKETPWIEARGNLPPAAPCNTAINIERAGEYYRARTASPS